MKCCNYTKKQFSKILKNNGFQLNRISGSHYIYENENGRHISVPQSMNACILKRLIKENNLIV